MKPLHVNINQQFIGREYEKKQLNDIAAYGEAAIIVLYGRRRVGKTELIEQTYARRNIIKIEGIEGRGEIEQRQHVLLQLSMMTQDITYTTLQVNTWTEIFELLSRLVQKGIWTLYFEEVQWLANYKSAFVAELKYAWDNLFRHNKSLRLILCGSSPSFMINEVLHSKALYNRSQFEIHLNPLPLIDVQKLLPSRSRREIMDAYLTLGGIPEYLKRMNQYSSLYLGICEEAFKENGFLSTEYQRIFISSLADSIHYKAVIEYLSQIRFATRLDIAKHIGIKPGGTLTALLKDLHLCGFIEEYTSFHLPHSPSLVRYAIADHYLMFYFKFIKPIAKQIVTGKFNMIPTQAIKQDTYYKWLGFAFEQFCRKNVVIIATQLGFSGIYYESGPYISKQLDSQYPNFQIDLIFNRADHVLTVCEIKYLQRKVDVGVIEEFERKLLLMPNPKKRTIHKVLIAANGATDGLINRHYFDQIITLDDFFRGG